MIWITCSTLPTKPMPSLRSIPAGFDPHRLADVDRRLSEIVSEHGVRICLAIESGSRAWGFPSPDSDYDCRFIFVRSVDDYLSPWLRRDVIETPLIDDLDVNGWDLAKALKLMLKGNAVVIEWLMSPIAYRGDPEFRERMLALVDAHTDRAAIARHYLHLGLRQRNTYFADGKTVALKKLFYALRPAAALRWLRRHPRAAIAPMHFPTLLDECDPPHDVRAIALNLIARKAVTRELGEGSLPDPIRCFIDKEFAIAEASAIGRSGGVSPAARTICDRFFRDIVTN